MVHLWSSNCFLTLQQRLRITVTALSGSFGNRWAARPISLVTNRKYATRAWEEAPVYSERERAALTLTDAVTRITGGHVPDSVFERAQAHFNEQELIVLGLP